MGDNPYNMIFLNSSSEPFYGHDTIAKQFKKLLDEKDEGIYINLRHIFDSLMITNDGAQKP